MPLPVANEKLVESTRDLKLDKTPGREQFFNDYLVQNGVVSQAQIAAAVRLQKQHRALLGELGIKHGYFTQKDVDQILAAQQGNKRKFGEVAIAMGFIKEAQLHDLLEAQSNNHFYLGEALIALGYLSQNDMYRHLADFKQATNVDHLELADVLEDTFDHAVIEQSVKLIHEFFYSEGSVAKAVAADKELPPPNQYNVYATRYVIKKKGFFQKKSYYSISVLLLSSWNHLIGGNASANNSLDDPSGEQAVARKLTDLNDLLCNRLGRLGYDCQHGPVQTTIPPFSHCLSIRYETSIEPLYVIYTEDL